MDQPSSSVSVDVAPSFETNFRAKLLSAMQPKRLLTFVLAMGFLFYLGLTHPLPEVRKMAVLTFAVLLLMRVGVIAASSFVSKREKARYTMKLELSDETIIMTNEAGPQDVGWEYVRSAQVSKRGAVLELRSPMYVFVDFAKTTKARELVALLRRNRRIP